MWVISHICLITLDFLNTFQFLTLFLRDFFPFSIIMSGPHHFKSENTRSRLQEVNEILYQPKISARVLALSLSEL